ncbi:ABC transporter permease [Zavarzinia sp.]|uniref:ABC transporter permease n=1 Tax=Zavarzinia sp. TaxID=2027920 RepID=UPI003BB7FDFF|nr:ABC transporter permease [Zavarzinia sp.]
MSERIEGAARAGVHPVVAMVARRLAIGFVTLFMVSLIIFFGVELLPGDFAAAVLGKSGTPETVAALRGRLGLDLPAHIRYLHWLGGMLQGDLGTSLSGDIRIADVLGGRLFNTFFLAAYAAVIAVPLAVSLGIVAALYRNSVLDRAINISTLGAISFPEFFVAYVLVLVFAIQLGWFPSFSQVSLDTPLGERLYVCLLPAVTLTMVTTAHMMRMTRAAIINVLSTPYIEMARLKGIAPWRVIVQHALPNALAPIINVIAVNIAYLIVGVVLVEVVFVYPGLGQLLVDSVSKRDLPVVQVASMIFAATYILLNLLADVLSIVSNPRLLHPR